MEKEFYMVPEEVFRVGNSTSPRMGAFRPADIQTFDQNGVQMIVANNRGVSLYTDQELRKTTLTGWIWKFRADTSLPPGLKMVPDPDKPGHYFVAPLSSMPVDLYKGLLEQFGLKAERVWRKAA
jgi:hypothetical protein